MDIILSAVLVLATIIVAQIFGLTPAIILAFAGVLFSYLVLFLNRKKEIEALLFVRFIVVAFVNLGITVLIYVLSFLPSI